MVGRIIGNIISYDQGYKKALGWRGKLEKIRETLIEYNDNFNVFTQYEKNAGSQAIYDIRVANENFIVSGALQEWHAMCDSAGDAIANVEALKAAEVRSWDGGRLNNEMDLVEKRIKLTLRQHGRASNELEAPLKDIYLEGIYCGDKNKERATAEVFAGIGGFLPGDADLRQQMAANRLSTAAVIALNDLRDSQDIRDAEEAATVAIQRLNGAKSSLMDVDSVLGYGGDLGNMRISDAIAERVDNTGEETVIKERLV